MNYAVFHGFYNQSFVWAEPLIKETSKNTAEIITVAMQRAIKSQKVTFQFPPLPYNKAPKP